MGAALQARAHLDFQKPNQGGNRQTSLGPMNRLFRVDGPLLVRYVESEHFLVWYQQTLAFTDFQWWLSTWTYSRPWAQLLPNALINPSWAIFRGLIPINALASVDIERSRNRASSYRTKCLS